MIAVLYVDALGIYPKMRGVDAWDVVRDARLYDGPFPIVAHPACGPWGKLRHMYKGSEGDWTLACRGVDQVRKWGGVLEHPSHSLLWKSMSLPKPGQGFDAHGGYSIEVVQSDWGHVARKRTWLYLVGVPVWLVSAYAAPFPGRAPTHWISGGRGKPGRRLCDCLPPGIKAASAQQRRRTPPLFARFLLTLAASTRWGRF